MPQSLSKRFNGNTKEVIEYTRLWGQQKAMTKYGVKDYVAFCKFLQEQTGNENFGARPAFGHTNRGNWAEELLDAFTTKILRMEAEKQHLAERLEETEKLLAYYKHNQALAVEPQISRVMALCKEGN